MVIQAYHEDFGPLPSRGMNFDFFCSLWYFRLQTPGADNQSPLVADMAYVNNTVLGKPNPFAVPSAKVNAVYPVRFVIHEELEHPSKDPALRISVGEFLTKVEATS